MKTVQDIIKENEGKMDWIWIWLNGKLLLSKILNNESKVNVMIRKLEVNSYEITEEKILSIDLSVECFKNEFNL